MNALWPTRVTLTVALAIVCFACSGESDAKKTTSGTAGSTVTELGAQLTIPVGAYTGCVTNLAGVRPQTEGSSGGDGTVTLSVADDGTLSAALSFGQWLSGTVAFAATSSTTAGLSAGPFELEMFDPTSVVAPATPGEAASPSNISVSAAAGTLVLAGDTLFISVYANNDTTRFSAYSTCPVPPSLPAMTIANSATQVGSIPSGSYAACTTYSGSEGLGTGAIGGDLTLTIAQGNGSLTATQSDGFPSVCNLAFDGTPGTTAALQAGQTCMISEPCGPPPSLGTSSAPSEATLTNMKGAIDIAGGALFINVVGDAPADACGSHVLSLICPPAL